MNKWHQPDQRQAFSRGALDSLPFILAGAPFAILFGTLAPIHNIDSWFTMALSALVFAGSSQYIALGLMQEQTPVMVIILVTLIVNARFMLYSFTLSPHYRHVSTIKRGVLPFFLTDGTFIATSTRLPDRIIENHRVAYYLGSATIIYFLWQCFTLTGIVVGQSISGIQDMGLEFAMVTTFISMLVPMLKNPVAIFAALISFILVWITRDWPYRSGFIFSVVVAAILATLLKTFLQYLGPTAKDPNL